MHLGLELGFSSVGVHQAYSLFHTDNTHHTSAITITHTADFHTSLRSLLFITLINFSLLLLTLAYLIFFVAAYELLVINWGLVCFEEVS